MRKLVVRAGNGPARTLTIADRPVVAGTDTGLALVLRDASAERRHFRIEARPVGLVLRDLGTAAGTKVNGDFVSQVRLNPGDRISVGEETIEVVSVGADAAATASAAAPAPAVVPVTPGSPARAVAPAAPPRRRERRRASLAPLVLLVAIGLAAAGAVFALVESRKAPPAGRSAARPERPRSESPAPAPKAAPDANVPPPYVPPPETEPSASAPAPTPIEPVAPPPAPVEIPEPPSASAGGSERPRETDREREARERTRREAAAEEALRRFDETLDDRIAKYEYAGPIADLMAIANACPAGVVRDRIELRLADLERAASAVATMKREIEEGKVERIELASGLSLRIVSAGDEGFTAEAGRARLSQKWSQLRPEDVRGILVASAHAASDRLDLSAFTALHGLPVEDAEDDLRRALALDPSVRPVVDGALAIRRGVEIPDGGFVLFEGRFVTPVEKGWLEKGYVRYEGKWLAHDEFMAARGFVKHDGRWLSPEEYERVLEAERAAAALAAKYLPKGLLDTPGHGEAKPWAEKPSRNEIDTKHYEIVTNLGEDVARDLAYTMEVLYTNFRSVFGMKSGGAKFTVNVVANREEYVAAWPRAAGGSLGFTSSGNMICTYYQPPMTTSVLMHEGTHQIIYKFNGSCPRWLHEGMASYFECSRFVFDAERKKVGMEVGLLNSMRLMGIQAQLRAGTAVPLDAFIRGEGGDVYQQGWALIYYLANGEEGRYAGRLFDFVEDASRGQGVRNLEKFQRIFGVRDMAAFEAAWKTFILALDPAKGIRVDSPHR